MPMRRRGVRFADLAWLLLSWLPNLLHREFGLSQQDMSPPSWAASLDRIANPAGGAAAGASTGNVRAAIARPAGATGVAFSHLAAPARMESGFNPTRPPGTA
ncbi:hypothetical protein E4T56_gene18021, partial [Termitomyces sp. T112]